MAASMFNKFIAFDKMRATNERRFCGADIQESYFASRPGHASQYNATNLPAANFAILSPTAIWM
jgi:hypothetical protein